MTSSHNGWRSICILIHSIVLLEDVITSAFVLAHYLAHHEPTLRYYVLGEPNFLNELRSHGLTVVEELRIKVRWG